MRFFTSVGADMAGLVLKAVERLLTKWALVGTGPGFWSARRSGRGILRRIMTYRSPEGLCSSWAFWRRGAMRLTVAVAMGASAGWLGLGLGALVGAEVVLC